MAITLKINNLEVTVPKGSTILDAAEKIQQLRPKANIIFESAFDCYMKKAFEIRCSGYLMQPIKNSDIQGELDNLRFAYAY